MNVWQWLALALPAVACIVVAVVLVLRGRAYDRRVRGRERAQAGLDAAHRRLEQAGLPVPPLGGVLSVERHPVTGRQLLGCSGCPTWERTLPRTAGHDDVLDVLREHAATVHSMRLGL